MGKLPKPPTLRKNGQVNPRSVGTAEAEMGARIRLRRVEMEMSQEALGNALGVSFQQVQKYEKGMNRVGATRLQKLAQILEVPITFFFGGNGREREAESLMMRDASFNLRLLRAYAAIEDQQVQRRLVALMESVAGIGDE